jgi:hypothetical protein
MKTQWDVLVISAMWEVEIGGLQLEVSPGKKKLEDPVSSQVRYGGIHM